jgi:O-antigen/teichoic acid export membrane protein
MIAKLKLLQGHQGFMKYFKNTSWLFLERVLKVISELFIGIWVARYLGPEHYGLLSYSQSFAGLFMVIATFGLNTIIVRELVKDESKKDLLLGTSFILQLFGAILVLLLIFLSVHLTSNDSFTNSLIFIIAFSTVFKSFNVIDFYFQSKVLSKYTVYVNMILLLISSIIKILLILNEASLLYFAYILLFESFVLAIGFIYFYAKNNISIFNWKFDKTLAISLLKDSWPLILSGLVITIYMKIDQVMIQEMLGSEAVGQYAAAVRLSEAWYFMPMIIVSSLFPAIVNSKKISEKLFYSRLQKLFTLLMWLSIIIAVLTTLYGQIIIDLLYGNQYYNSGSVLVVHIWAGLAVSYGIVWSKWLLVENKQKYIIIFHVISMILNIGYNYFFIRIQGIDGAAIATALSSITAQAAGIIFYKRKVAVSFLINSINPMKFKI